MSQIDQSLSNYNVDALMPTAYIIKVERLKADLQMAGLEKYLDDVVLKLGSGGARVKILGVKCLI